MDQEAGFMVNFINSYFIALGVLIGAHSSEGSEHIWQANPAYSHYKACQPVKNMGACRAYRRHL